MYTLVQWKSIPAVQFAHTYTTDKYRFEFTSVPGTMEISIIEQIGIIRKDTGGKELLIPEGAVHIRLQDFAGSLFAGHTGTHRHSTVGLKGDYELMPLQDEEALERCRESLHRPWPPFMLLLPVCIPRHQYSTNIQSLLQSILHISHTEQTGAALQCSGLCLELMACLSRDCVRNILAQDSAAGMPPSALSYSRRAMDYIAAHFSEPLTVPEIARGLHISPNYLSALFKASTGKSVMQYVTDIRLRTVGELLAQKKATLAEAGRMVGIEDANYLSRLFRKHFGVSAREMFGEAGIKSK